MSKSKFKRKKLLKSDNIQKYVMSLESEKNIYVTGSTILAMKGIITYEEYITNKFNKNIRQDILDKKFYLQDILGALRGMTRLKMISSDSRSPSVTMYRRMIEEDEEIVANGGRFSSDSEDSDDDNPSSLNHPSQLLIRNISKLKSNRKMSKLKSDSPADPTNNNWLVNNAFTLEKNNEEENTKEKISPREGRRKARDDITVMTNSSLPDELLNCGDCGTRISSVQHLERHLERCRGSKKKRSLPLRNRKRTSSEADQYFLGKLTVCDTEDGEVIEGWGPTMGAIPPGPSCPRCAFEVPTLYDLPLHQKYHTGSENLTCPVCTFSTDSLPDYLIHVEEHAS